MTSMDSRALASHGRRVAGPQPTLWDRVSKNLPILLANPPVPEIVPRICRC